MEVMRSTFQNFFEDIVRKKYKIHWVFNNLKNVYLSIFICTSGNLTDGPWAAWLIIYYSSTWVFFKKHDHL